MYRLLACITQEHDHGLVALAALVCVFGSCLSTLLSRRLVTTSGRRRDIQLVLVSLLAGTTIWSTHFIAMLAYEPGFEHGYEPTRTLLSLIIAVLGMAVSFTILSRGKNHVPYVLGGAVFGLTVSMMHYVGMSAYLIPGSMVWNPPVVFGSILMGISLGIAAFHRIIRPITRYCWAGGAILLVLAICAMHFSGMSAFEIQLDSAVVVPPELISDTTLGLLILSVTGIIYLFGFASFGIEMAVEKESHGQLERAALEDSLTGLPNRMRLNQKIREYSKQLKNEGEDRVAALTIDLNLFKEVNDLYGHGTGDLVLKSVSTRLANILQEGEFLARTGGDEFVALKREFQRMEQVMAFAQRLHAVIVEPIETSNGSVTVGAAIGIATSIEDGDDIADLLHKSDLAMYRAKAEPEVHISFYNAEIDQQSRDKLMLVQDLRLAIERDEFELYYQLQNDISTLEPVGFEALIRWNHPERGRVSPGEFIPVAEETGLIREIGLWVLRTACHEATTWPTSLSVAVNVAPQQLVQPSFIEHVSDILIESRLRPERLEIEITESSIIDDQAHTLSIMRKLKDMGVRIAMDDFGTGYSSLATLQAFPFDKIKIDRSFIQNVHADHQSAAIVRSTLQLGAALNTPVLAEGVEEQLELDFLRDHKCNSVQGFYFGKPMSKEEVHSLIRKSAERMVS